MNIVSFLKDVLSVHRSTEAGILGMHVLVNLDNSLAGRTPVHTNKT